MPLTTAAAHALGEVDAAIEPRKNAFALAYRGFWRNTGEDMLQVRFSELATAQSASRGVRAELAATVFDFTTKNITPRLVDVSNEALAQIDGVIANAAVGADVTGDCDAQADALALTMIGDQVQAWLDVARFLSDAPNADLDTADVLRGVTGLKSNDAVSVARYHLALISKMSRKEAARAWSLLTNRATLTAENELARAHQNAKRLAHRRALDAGLVSEVRRTWATEADERVCAVCRGLDGKVLVARAGGTLYKAFGKDDSGRNINNPPAHFRCRCAVVYEVAGGLT